MIVYSNVRWHGLMLSELVVGYTRELSYKKKRLDIVHVVAAVEKQKRTQRRSFHNA